MIEAKELRVGNILTGGIVVQTNEVSFKVYDGYVAWDSSQMVSDWMKEQPIPLTEETLLTIDTLQFINLNYIATIHSERKNEVELRTKSGEHIKWIKYLHEWQNFHHAYTGEELTIKE